MTSSAAKAIKVGVVPMGRVPDMSPRVIAAYVGAYFHLEADVLKAQPIPMDAFDAARMQYDAGLILNRLEKEEFQGYEKIIAVLSSDLFVPVFTHVIGEARQDGRCALISLFRMQEEVPAGKQATSLLLERCAKAALHEIGHLFNLIHCSDPLCLMHMADNACELDQRSFNLCRYCKLFLAQRLMHHRSNTNLCNEIRNKLVR
jgi:archaemetzincin